MFDELSRMPSPLKNRRGEPKLMDLHHMIVLASRSIRLVGVNSVRKPHYELPPAAATVSPRAVEPSDAATLMAGGTPYVLRGSRGAAVAFSAAPLRTAVFVSRFRWTSPWPLTLPSKLPCSCRNDCTVGNPIEVEQVIKSG